MKIDKNVEIRESEQPLIPSTIQHTEPGIYNIYPHFPVGEGKIERGYKSIAAKISHFSEVIIDGYVGVLWENFQESLNHQLELQGISSEWLDVSDCMLREDKIEEIKKPFLGDKDPIFGTRFTGSLSEFFDLHKLENLEQSKVSDLTILYGCGASLVNWSAPIVYVDLPKNEIQFRSRAGSITNLGRLSADDPKKIYKEFYFIDWIALNKHKSSLIDRLYFIIDEQNPEDPAIMTGKNFREGLEMMSKNVFRVRPWFEPGVWGGQWCKTHIPQLPGNVPNYAWSFEMIVPENGILFSSGKQILETSFDWLMYYDKEAILGESADRFGYEFPIRFDFLDTFNGENLSLQCHPRPDYIKSHFGESFTQDETYYILDCEDDAEVYLGFKKQVNPDQLREELEKANRDGSKFEAKKHILTHTANKHDLFLIPSGTVHCSGRNNLVLEISATPYIFTFKMYDWQRLDLDGNPRPINIERAFENLQFDRKGRDKIEKEFISTPEVIESGNDWQLVHLPTHPEHFYDICRYDFQSEVRIETKGSCHVMNLVEGNSIILKPQNGVRRRFNYAESFTVPAAADSYRMINEGDQPAKVVQAFLKSGNATNLISS